MRPTINPAITALLKILRPEIDLSKRRLETDRQVIGRFRSEGLGAGFQAADNSRVVSSQIQWASARAWRWAAAENV